MTYFRAVKGALVVFGVFFLAGAATGAPAFPASGDSRAVAGWLTGLGDRREGSAAENQVFDALDHWFEGRADVHRDGFTALDGEHSFSQRLWFRVGGTTPGELVVVAPTDGVNHPGVAWAVAWADAVLRRGTPVSITFLFTGAERGPVETSHLGSRTFLQDFYPTTPAAVLYLDAADTPGVELTAESGIFPSPLWMVQGLSEAFSDQNLGVRLTGTAPSLFRLDLPERRNALDPWFQRSIPGIWISGGPGDPAVVRALVGFSKTLNRGVPADWDRHWIEFDLGFWRGFWGQDTYLGVYLGIVAVLVFGYALLNRRRRGTVKVLARGFWQVPVLLAFAFLALESGTALASSLMAARGQPELWRQLPLLVWSFKALVAVTLYVLLFLPFRRTPLSRNPDFYEQSALLWLGAMTLGATAFELSFSFYFLWAVVWASVQLLAPWRWLKLVSLTVGPLWLFKAVYDVLGSHPDLELTRWTLASPVAGNFALAVLFFPFLLQVTGWHFSGRRHQNRDEGLRALIQLALWGAATVGVGLLLLRFPAPPVAPPAPVETIDLTQGAKTSPLWTTQVDRSAFLDRTVWNFEFFGTLDPEEVRLDLVATRPLTIFNCSFPVVLDPDGHRARIVVGRQPPLPLSLKLTLPQDTVARLEVHARFPGKSPIALVDAVDLRP